MKIVHAISNSNHIDVLEMDAASKTGVDDVRDLDRIFQVRPNILQNIKYLLLMKFICLANKHLMHY